MAEFDLINRHFSRLGAKGSPLGDMLITGVGDDAAVLAPPAQDQQLVMAMDTLVAGVHFPLDTPPHAIGYKSLAVNLSDMAAMGATPLYCLLSITMPDADDAWCEALASGINELAVEHHVQVIGGDTSRGPLSLSIQMTGAVEKGKAILRSGARPEDDIYVTGKIGAAGAGLLCKKGQLKLMPENCQEFIHALNYPHAQIAAGLALSGIASAAIDISDGLYQDLKHICEQSGYGADIKVDAIPLADHLPEMINHQPAWQFALHSGDDYHLCFTAAVDMRQHLETICRQQGMLFYRIGRITASDRIRLLASDETELGINKQGYQHFSTEVVDD